MTSQSFDVLIVGGGVMGSSIAYFLANHPDAQGLRIGVVERDPGYTTTSTALSVGGIRHQFSTRENVLLSLYTSEFVRSASETLRVGDESPEVWLVENGYLFLASEPGKPTLESNQALQNSLGADIHLLDAADLKGRFPWLHVDDLACGGFGMTGEGWIDPYSLLQAFRKKAQSLGVEYLHDEVTSFEMDNGKVTSARTASGRTHKLGTVVNAAGPRAREVAALVGIPDLPVFPRKRFVYRVTCPESFPTAPLTIDTSGVYFRPEGPEFLCGVSPLPEDDPDTYDLTMDYRLFEDVVWPALAHRVPAFERLKVGSSWAGLYSVTAEDHNAVIGPHPEITNFIFANGFSGHGLQHSPGVGRGVAEYIISGEYRTIDLTRFGFSRFERGALILEEKVI
jgi:FAD-dependent oxidoreductase domain-containing protein 1